MKKCFIYILANLTNFDNFSDKTKAKEVTLLSRFTDIP